MKIGLEKGTLTVSDEVFSHLAGVVATNCFGVKGMAARSKADGLVHLLRREAVNRGVNVTTHEDGSVTIEVHIIVDSGVNINAISQSISNEVGYKIKQYTGIEVQAVDIYVDSISFR